MDLVALLARLAEEEIDSVLVEGGGEVAWSFLAQDLGQKLYLFYGPVLLGGREVPGVGGSGVKRLTDAFRVRIDSLERLGDEFLVVAYRQWPQM